ncbi:NADH:flavin oxidoreductase, partial [Chloroflexota bacterium]
MMTQEHDLFSPIEIGSVRLDNRLVRSATAECLVTEPLGRATPALASLYRELAEGGVGLIVTGHAYVHPQGRAHPEMLSVHCD